MSLDRSIHCLRHEESSRLLSRPGSRRGATTRGSESLITGSRSLNHRNAQTFAPSTKPDRARVRFYFMIILSLIEAHFGESMVTRRGFGARLRAKITIEKCRQSVFARQTDLN